ncbi:MAG: zf-HC2 domain-containing protein [Acetatifactor sp.]|nr:zf-HC2 domain-containing protein [Acetatifactor sp.]
MKCNIVKDLFPLYLDGLCSEETRKQLEEHIASCENCRQLKQSMEQESVLPGDSQDWKQSILPLKKVKKKMRRKNLIISVCVFFLLLFVGVTAVLAYGQITKTGISFELIYDAVRFKHIGEQFASGNIEPLYEQLSDGFIMRDEEAAVVHMAYADKTTYDAEMKKAIMNKYRQYFGGKNLTYKGIEEICYSEPSGMGEYRTIYIALKFEGTDHIEYYIGLYKSLDGKYIASDYFGNPYLSYTSEMVKDGANSEYVESYHTDDSLFSCLPNRLKDGMMGLTKQMILSSGQRAMQGDTALAEYGQMRIGIQSEQDMAEGTNDLRNTINQNLDKLTEWDYYVTDISFHVKEYDKARYLYRYQMDIELTNPSSMDCVVVSLDCYRISENFIYIDGSDKIYREGNDLPLEVMQILERLFQ